MGKKLLEVNDLQVKFKTANGLVNALNGVSFDIMENESIGFVGESGCGKSVTARAILRILEKNSILTGGIKLYNGSEAVNLAAPNISEAKLRSIRGGKISMIFQEPMSSLCPVYTVGNQIIEAIRLHSSKTKKEARDEAVEYLAQVGITRPEKIVNDYPYQLSGGMRQRVMIAMALSANPTLLIADEPTTALDVTVSAQILHLIQEIQEQRQMSVMMINHNLGIISETCSRVFVMYLGRIVENGTVNQIFDNPTHPYTCDLLRSIPRLGMKRGEALAHIRGYVPDPLNIPAGCSYHNRCQAYKAGKCNTVIPPLEEVEEGHFVACHRCFD